MSNVKVRNHVNIVDYLVVGGQVCGAWGIDLKQEEILLFTAKAVICATGGAAGLYQPNHPGTSRHKMWYSPFNTGAGYAMGLRAGAEMTTFEMRFIALRCKGTIAPTGTIAQGVGAPQVNSRGEKYQGKYGNTTAQRLWAVIKENLSGHGPCYLATHGISPEQAAALERAYLNMAPAQTLFWRESGLSPQEFDVEIEGSEPYVVGGHTASGYWIGADRSTTLPGLFAAGDVAGGCPQKYVTGLSPDNEMMDKWKATISSMLQFTKDDDGDHPMLGQFTTQSVTPHMDQLRMYASLFAGETGLTLDDLGFVGENPSSAESIRATHENMRLTARKAQRNFGTGFLNVGYLAACVRDNFPYKRNQLYQTKPRWEPVFEPDAAQLSGIGDAAIKIQQSFPDYFTEEKLHDLTGI
jgi:hypothetical protein